MSNDKQKLVVVITYGLDDERSSVAWSIANGGINNGLDVTIFLTSNAVDWVRKGAADRVHLNPEDPPMIDMINKVIDHGCFIGVCPPCAKVRGYDIDSLLPGVTLIGSKAIHDRIKEGAATLTF